MESTPTTIAAQERRTATMMQLTVRYARYALSALSSVAFAMTAN